MLVSGLGLVSSLVLFGGCASSMQVSQPNDGRETVRNVGSEIYEYLNFVGTKHLITTKSVALPYENEKIQLQSGEKLYKTSENNYCISKKKKVQNDIYGKEETFNVCTKINEDDISQSDTFKFLYETTDPSSFKYELLYQGVQDKVLRLTYREFTGNFARPAFYQELTYNLNNTGSTIIKFKNLDIEVLEANNNSIKYKILKSN